ncbi:T9SS type A sorting domain-containing protein [Flavicella sediminum]|uniref:T9SS type A sorting domain-containing protein n=1 Tax=Flavicella sediminum TaxID=2585141 RepID=UPI00111E630B|nr:T9SS type A sorting domain-containing protein [Flavicella sediminum]
MKKQLLKKITFAIACFAISTVSAQLTTFSTDLDGWAKSWGANSVVTHDATGGLTSDGALKLERLGANSNFGIKGTAEVVGIDADAMKYIRLRFKNETGGVQLRLGGTNGDAAAIKTNEGGDINFSIGGSSDEYTTMYLDMSTTTLWKGALTNFYLMVRNNEPDTAGDYFILDEIEFLASAPATTYSDFILNPGFDGPSGIAHLSGNKAFVTRGITATEAHDGTQSLKNTFSGDADSAFWTFSSYEKTYEDTYEIGHAIQIKMWVKTNRATPISMSARVKTTLAGENTASKPIVTVATTNTAMEWEELTFNLTNAEAFDGITFWFALNWVDGEAANLVSGDVVYIDQISATISEEVPASVGKNTLEEVAIYPNPVADQLQIEAPLGSEISITNLAGVTVKSVTDSANKNVINTSNLASGIYIAKVTNGLKFFIEKVVVK